MRHLKTNIFDIIGIFMFVVNSQGGVCVYVYPFNF